MRWRERWWRGGRFEGSVVLARAGALMLGAVACTPASSADTHAPEPPASSANETRGATDASSTDEDLSPRERLERRVAARRGETGALPTVELELEQLASGHLVLPARAAGHDFLFILDTGASTSVMTPATRDRLGLDPDAGMSVKAAGASGSVDDVRLLTVEELSVGPRAYREVVMAVMDLSHLEVQLEQKVDGILGRNFLVRNDVEIDFVQRRLRMYKSGAVQAGELDVTDMRSVAYDSFPAGLMRISVRLEDDVEVPAVFDLGAARSVINWRAAAAAGVDPRRAKELEQGEDLVGADDRTTKTVRRTFSHLAAGELVVEGPELHIADLDVFNALEVADQPAMVFGLDMVDDRRLVIDYARQRIFFSAAAAATSNTATGS